MFLLKILLHLLFLGKFLSINVRKVFATFVVTLMLKKVGVEPGNFSLSRLVLFIIFINARHIKL